MAKRLRQLSDDQLIALKRETDQLIVDSGGMNSHVEASLDIGSEMAKRRLSWDASE